MNVSYIIRFRGVAPKAKGKLDKMVRDDFASYPSRMNMDSVTVETVKKGKANAQS
ncbi:hypothetical protein LCGC14_2525070, partial [marine sediment metagenome]